MLETLECADVVEMTQAELATAEQVIAGGLRTFVDVGNALLAIRDQRGYRLQGFKAFDDYCRERWGMERRRAYELMGAAQTVANLSSMDDIPANERQARALRGLEPDQQREAWALAVETAPEGKVTAAHVERVVDTLTGEITTRTPAANVIHVSDDSYEWYTPHEVIEAARATLGGIDLDPASCFEANAMVKAKRYYTKDDNGLTQSWQGRVWLNPPYNMPLVDQFADKVIAEYEAGNVSAALVLTNNSTDTRWYHKLAQYPLCLTRGRVTFWNGDNTLAARQGQTIFYLGPNPQAFAAHFGALGLVLRRYDDKRPG